jgi:tetratricopeptide (TPR) repeat protein
MNDRAFLSVFTPSRTPPEDLEAITVQRHALLDDAVERVRESATTGNKHHLLFVGARGTGKTHLVTLLVHRLGQDRTLDAMLRIAWLNEDETSTSLLELLRRIYDALLKRYPDEFTPEALDPLFDLTPEDAEEALTQLLLETLQSRTLLVLMENLDTLFEGLGQAGQQKLRAFIQEHPVLSIVATAQRLVDDIAKRQSAFFGFFQTEHLKILSVEQARALLRNIARLNRQADVVSFLDSATGRSRIRALHHLSGGNHRIYIVLSQFINRDSIQALVDPFAKMVDEMTPYYQERIRWLPAQQRKIVEYLCTRDRPTPVKEIARRLFATQQTVSSQLKDLRGKGYVQAAQRGRESLYEIAEPMMRICVEVKENQTHRPLRVLVDFLRVWYDARELNTRLSEDTVDRMAHAYLASAIKANHVNGNLRVRLLVDAFDAELDEAGRAHWGPRIEACAGQSEELALACGHCAKGEEAEALRILDEIGGMDSERSKTVKLWALELAAEIYYKQDELVLARNAFDALLALPSIPVEDIARALVNRGAVYGQLGDSDKAIADYSVAVDLPQAPVEAIARALVNRGAVYGQLGDSDKAIADYSAAVDLPQVPVEQIARALVNRGAVYGQLGDSDKAIADYSAAIDLPQAPVEDIARALVNRGAVYGQLGDSDKAIADYSAAVDLPQVPVEDIARALVNRGAVYGQLGDSDKAIADYSAAIDLPQAPVEDIARALVNRGAVYGQFGDSDKAIADYSAAIDLPQVPVEQIARALFNRGLTYGQLGESDKEVADYSAAIDLPQAPVEQIAWALFNRGVAYSQLGKRDRAIADYSAAIDLPQAPVEDIARALVNRGAVYGQLGDSDKAIADYSAAIDLPQAPVEQVTWALVNRGAVYSQLGESDRAVADFSAAIDLPQARVEQVAWALFNRGVVYGQLGDTKQALADYSAAISLPKVLIEQTAQALVNRGVVYGQLGDIDQALADFSAAIDLPQARAEQIAWALFNRGLVYGQLGHTDEEVADYSAVIDLSQAPLDLIGRALVNRGAVYSQLGDSDKAIADYGAIIDLPQVAVELVATALFNRGLAHWQLRDSERSRRDLEATFGIKGTPIETRVDSRLALVEIHVATGRWDLAMTTLRDGLLEGIGFEPAYQGDSTDIIGAFFDSSLQPAIRRERTRALLQVYRDAGAIAKLGEALTRHLGRLHGTAATLPSPDNLETWAAAWEDAGEGIDAFRLALRIFRTGVDFLKAGGNERGILLDLNQEERVLLEQVFSLESES